MALPAPAAVICNHWSAMTSLRVLCAYRELCVCVCACVSISLPLCLSIDLSKDRRASRGSNNHNHAPVEHKVEDAEVDVLRRRIVLDIEGGEQELDKDCVRNALGCVRTGTQEPMQKRGRIRGGLPIQAALTRYTLVAISIEPTLSSTCGTFQALEPSRSSLLRL